MKYSKPRFTIFLMNFGIAVFALISTSNHSVLFPLILLASLLQLFFLVHISLKKVFNIPNLTLLKDTLVYRGLFITKKFEVKDLVIERNSFSGLTFYMLNSSNTSATIHVNDLTESEIDLLNELEHNKNALFASL